MVLRVSDVGYSLEKNGDGAVMALERHSRKRCVTVLINPVDAKTKIRGQQRKLLCNMHVCLRGGRRAE
ncbi:hypothetical protein BDW75DRAFT_216714 [Aspergillus navahoensis]